MQSPVETNGRRSRRCNKAPKTTQPLTQAHSATSPKLSLTRSTSQTDPRHGTGAPHGKPLRAATQRVVFLVQNPRDEVEDENRWPNLPNLVEQTQTLQANFCLPLQKRMAWILQMCQDLGDHFGVSGAYHRQTISPTSPIRRGSGAHRASQPHPSHCKGNVAVSRDPTSHRVVVMSRSWHKQPHNWASWALANLCVISGRTTLSKNVALALAQWTNNAQADCKSGTAGIRDKNSSCSWILPSKWAETKSGCPSGVPNTLMPCCPVGRSEPFHTLASGCSLCATDSNASQAGGLTPPWFHTWVFPVWIRMPQWW